MKKLAALILLCCATAAHANDKASWYGEERRGMLMANGKRFNPDKLTAASWFYALGTRVIVSHGSHSVTVEITDRGPAKYLVNQGRKIDLSHAAFVRLADPKRGLIAVTINNLARR
jgi:rare lipoprotein A